LTNQSVFPDIVLTLESVIRSVIAMQTTVAEILAVEFPNCALDDRRGAAVAVAGAQLRNVIHYGCRVTRRAVGPVNAAGQTHSATISHITEFSCGTAYFDDRVIR
jgi:hypothetical protein